MKKGICKSLFVSFLTILLAAPVFAQTITIRNFDTGPYGPGSTISVPFHLENNVVFTSQNSFQLFLSNAAGVYPATPLVTVNDIYATYINAVIPAGTPAGSGYKLKIVLPNPVNPANPPVATVETAAFTVSGSTAVTAGMTAPEVVRAPDMLGVCSAEKTGNYTFTNSSSAGIATITAYNEISGTTIALGDNTLNPTVVFDPSDANYTITVRNVNNGITGTYSYTLFNRPFYKSFGSAGTNTVCLSGGGTLTYNVDIGSPTGLQNNYPGLLYQVTWGDGSTSTLTIAEIKAASGKIAHTYFTSSCGRVVNNQKNVFKVDLTIVGVICDPHLNPTTEYAKVLQAPVNKIGTSSPKNGCTGDVQTFINDSFTGQNASSDVSSCENADARYTWLVDGNVRATNRLKGEAFNWTFNTPGDHIVTLRFENPDVNLCTTVDVAWPICIKTKPVASFTIPATTCLATPVTPNTTATIVDAVNCTDVPNEFTWTVTPASGRSIQGGNTRNPVITFTAAGVYTVNMSISGACTVNAPPQVIRVDAPPVATLSPNATLCGIDVPRKFDDTPESATRTIITGTPVDQSDNYTWTITGGNFDFVAPTDEHTRYPTIVFHDEAVYTVKVKHENNCGIDDNNTQTVTLKNAPVPNPGTYQPACPNVPIQLNAVAPTPDNVTGVEWTGAGTFSNRFSLNPTYLPTTAERDAGVAKLTFILHTSIAGCEDIPSAEVAITIKPLNTITSPDAKPVCNDTRVDYNPIAAPGSTFRWSFVAGANAEVVPGPQSGTKITDLIRNNDLAGQDVIVVYTIIPVFDGCDGVPFTFTVTVSPKTISADFTASATEGCGATLLTFTSVSESATSVFNWSVSDGATFTGPIFQHEFQPQDDGSGREKIYAVTLTVINSCAAVPPTKTIEVRISPSTPLPLISAEASGACGLVDITAHNLSPGTNVRYTFSLVDETGNLIQPAKPPVTTKEDQIFTAVQPPLNGTQNVFVKLEVEDKCGTKVSSLSPPIILTPSALVSDVTLDKTFICLGEQVVFTNNSTGTSFAYKVYVKGETVPFITIPVNNRDDLPFEFSSAGDFEVSITPSSGCGPAPESVKKEITVYDVPGAEFTEAVVDCDNLTHQFTVVGPVNPGYNYTWNYGDGSPLVNTPSPAPHTYASSGIYPVTLTVKNVQDCGTTGTPKQVVVNPALIADFSVLPADTIFIPNYHFSFRDQSQGLPVTWAWNFDDKDNSLSTTQNPEFTYTAVDTGYHNITLTITDNNGCPKTIVKVVKITGTPGQLFVPNAFIPTSSSTAIKTFAAKGKGIKAWKMQIYNKWGQLVWQTDKLTSEGEPDEGWDGNYQGQPAPQGAYLWQIEATFVNGTRWKGMSYRNSPPKRTGVINLIR